MAPMWPVLPQVSLLRLMVWPKMPISSPFRFSHNLPARHIVAARIALRTFLVIRPDSGPGACLFPQDDLYNIAAVNMSLGGGKYTSSCDTDSRKAAIDNLRSAGIATVISSGNDYYTNGIGAPACISTAVSVGATTKSDVEASYSNYHPTMLSLFAPGSSIYSSVPGGGWETWNGTSMAAPHVTGAWAILKQKSPSASVTDILNNLQTTGAAVTLKAGRSGRWYSQENRCQGCP